MFVCKIKKIDCVAEKADMTWLDRLEDAIFVPRDREKKRPRVEDKSDKKTARRKKPSKQER